MMRSRWRRLLRLVPITLGLVGLALLAWAFWWEPRRLVVRSVTLTLPCWTGDPLLLGLVSDLHVGSPGTGLAKLDRIVDSLNAGRPDAILLLGDFVIQGVKGGRFVAPETIAARLGRLRAPFGVHAVLGNHDWWLDGPRVERAFERAGIPVLDDEAVLLHTSGGPLWLVGISDFWQGRHDVARALRGVTTDAAVLAMTHNPDIFPSLPGRVCLTVAGHTHGGQVALPLIGRPVVPSKYAQRYAAGHIEEGGRHLFVTSGVGTSIVPVRFRVPPEILFLRIEATPESRR